MIKLTKILLLSFLILWSFQVVSQPNLTVRLEPASGNGCGSATSCANDLLCFDVYLSVDEDGWNLQSYDIWMNYGPDNSVLSYQSDVSCNHTNGGDIDVDVFGKYRFLAANVSLPLIADTEVLIHNFCVNVKDYNALAGLTVTAGGVYYNLRSSVNLVNQANQNNAVNPNVPPGGYTIELSNILPNLLITDPAAVNDPEKVDLTAVEVTAGSDAGTLSYWTDAAATTPLANPSAVSTSGTYYIKLTNSAGCEVTEPVTVTVNGATPPGKVKKPKRWSKKVRVYPNPFSNYLKIKNYNLIDRIVMVNTNGQIVIDLIHPGHKISTRKFVSGTYTVTMIAEGEVVKSEVVIKR